MVPDSTAARPGARKRTTYAYTSTRIEPVATAPGQVEADPFQHGVESDDREQHADPDHGTRHGVADRRGTCRPSCHHRPPESLGVRQDHRDDDADQHGDRHSWMLCQR